MKPLFNANVVVLQQLEQLTDLCGSVYHLKFGGRSAIGDHVRHVLDHYRAVETGISTGLIDYNLRHRESPEATDPEVAQNTIKHLQRWLQSPLPDVTVDIVSDIEAGVAHAPRLPSMLSREMLYLINHSIHHMAFASLLARQQGIELPPTIGIAPSTANFYQHSENTHAETA